jgi:hypothetical protein
MSESEWQWKRKRPSPVHLLRDLEGVRPGRAGADFVGARPAAVLRAEGPRAVRVYAALEPVEVKAVGHVVVIPDGDAQPAAGARVDDRARHAAVEGRLVHVGQHYLVGLGDEEAGVEVLSVDERVEAARLDLFLRYHPVFVPRVAHAVAPVCDPRRHLLVRRDGRVVGDGFDFEVDVLHRHG